MYGAPPSSHDVQRKYLKHGMRRVPLLHRIGTLWMNHAKFGMLGGIIIHTLRDVGHKVPTLILADCTHI